MKRTILGLITGTHDWKRRYSRKTMPGGIFWDAGDSPRGAFGARQDARGRRIATFTITMVSLALNRVGIFKTFTLVLPVFLPVAHRSLHLRSFCFLVYTTLLYRIPDFMGIAQDKLSKTITPFFTHVLLLEAPT